MKKSFLRKMKKSSMRIYQELVDKLKPANAEEEKFYAAISRTPFARSKIQIGIFIGSREKN